MSAQTSAHLKPFRFVMYAYLVHVVVFPHPCSPTNMITFACFFFGAYGSLPGSSIEQSSLHTACSSIFRLFSPPASASTSTFFVTFSRRCFTCATFTSACSSALQISMSISFTTDSSITVACVILRSATATFEPRSASTIAAEVAGPRGELRGRRNSRPPRDLPRAAATARSRDWNLGDPIAMAAFALLASALADASCAADPYLSVVLASRDDDYAGRMAERFVTAIALLALREFCCAHCRR